MGKRGFTLGILIMAMLLLLDASQPGANGSFLKELNGDTIIADNMELEFLMDSEISRKLTGGSQHVVPNALNANKEVIIDCGKPPSYTSCLPRGGNPKKGETCDVYHHKRGGC